MRVLITGGCGFIGRNLYKLLKDEHDVIVIDDLSTSKIMGCYDFYKIDLGNMNDIEKNAVDYLIGKVDIVFHLAGSVGVKNVMENPNKTLQNSFKINNNLFPLFEKHNTKVVYASTSEVYGDVDNAKETDDLKIGSPTNMRWGYACGKLMSEFLINSYNFPFVIVRFFNVTGQEQLSDYGMVLPSFIKKAKNDEDIIVYGDGEQYRTFCDIRDAVQMLCVVGFGDKHNGEIYNIGNDENLLTINELADEVVRVVGSDSDIIHVDPKEVLGDKFVEIYKRSPNIEKIKSYYKPRYTIEDIIRSMI